MESLLLVKLRDPDGKVVIEEIIDETHMQWVMSTLHPDDYALVGGVILKDFDRLANKDELKKALEIMSKNKKYKR